MENAESPAHQTPDSPLPSPLADWSMGFLDTPQPIGQTPSFCALPEEEDDDALMAWLEGSAPAPATEPLADPATPLADPPTRPGILNATLAAVETFVSVCIIGFNMS